MTSRTGGTGTMKDRDTLDIKWSPDTQKTTKTDRLLARFDDDDDTNNAFDK